MTSVRAEPHIFVAFRNDDPSACSDLGHEREVFALFEQFGVPQTLGVIPNTSLSSLHCPDGDETLPLYGSQDVCQFLSDYVERTGSEVAMHGFTHQTNRYSIPSRQEYSEFCRLPLGEQVDKISAGGKIIEQALGRRPVTFIPPWNRLDSNTLTACERCGIKVVSAGAYTAEADNLISFGTNTNLAAFAGTFSEAKKGRGQVFLNVLFHSRTLHTQRDKELLARALATVSQSPECEPLTVWEAVSRFPDETREFNAAGRNVVDLHEAPGSIRARAAVYTKGVEKVGWKTVSKTLRKRAQSHYWRGEYESCRRLTRAIDRTCRVTAWTGRTLATLSGCAVGSLALLLFGRTFVLGLSPWPWLCAVAVLCGGVPVVRAATAADTRKEVALSTLLAAGGVLLVAALHSFGRA